MDYLANWRMQVATQQLRNTSISLAQLAEIVGYDSEAAFSRSFKKAFGTRQPPGDVRIASPRRGWTFDSSSHCALASGHVRIWPIAFQAGCQVT